MADDVIYFASPAEFRAWLHENHDTATEQQVGYYKKGTGKPSMTWAESVDQALCYGWIDGIRRSVDEERYKIRFTPRKARSTWSNVNINRVNELTAHGLMQPAGLKAFEQRAGERSGIYAFEQPEDAAKLSEAEDALFHANEAAWTFFEGQAPHYQHSARWWVVSAKKAETRQKRMAQLIDDSANGQRISQFRPLTKKK